MIPLLLAALFWIGLHLGIAGTRLRGRIAARTGEAGFRLGFSAASVVAITALVVAWQRAGTAPLWTAPDALRWGLAALMLPAFVLFAGSVMAPNPTAVGGERAPAAAPRGVLRITRHPMLWSFALWALAHVLGNGEAAATVFFGAFLVTALAGMPSLDAKLAARDPARWRELAAATTILPFGAAARNRIVWGELAWPALVGLLAWAAMLRAHPWLFGVSPLPG